MDRVIGKVYETTDYSKFKRMTGNRDVEKRAKKYLENIAEVGIITPVIVNELWEIVDGQARVQCGIWLEIPIPYIMIPGLRLEAVLDVNRYVMKWNAREIVHGYAENGNLGHMYLESLSKQFKQFELSTIYFAVSGRTCNSNQIIEDVKNHGISVNAYNSAIKKLEYLAEVNPFFAHIAGTKRPCQAAILWLYDQEEVDKDRLKDSIKKRCTTLLPMPNNIIAMEQIEAVYNWHRQNALPLTLMYKTAIKSNQREYDRKRRSANKEEK